MSEDASFDDQPLSEWLAPDADDLELQTLRAVERDLWELQKNARRLYLQGAVRLAVTEQCERDWMRAYAKVWRAEHPTGK